MDERKTHRRKMVVGQFGAGQFGNGNSEVNKRNLSEKLYWAQSFMRTDSLPLCNAGINPTSTSAKHSIQCLIEWASFSSINVKQNVFP